MHDDLIQVAPDAVRGCAAELADSGYRLAYGPEAVFGLAVGDPRWHTGAALGDVAAAMRRRLRTLGDETVGAAAGLRAAMSEYEAADDRAARRTAALR